MRIEDDVGCRVLFTWLAICEKLRGVPAWRRTRMMRADGAAGYYAGGFSVAASAGRERSVGGADVRTRPDDGRRSPVTGSV